MGYREEREALRARAEAMEQELSQARGELRQAQQELSQARQSTPWERLEQLERELAAAQRAVQELRTQMTATERPPRRGAGLGPVVAGATVGVFLLGTVTALFLVMRPSPRPAVVVGPTFPTPPAPPPPPVPRPGKAVGDAPAPELPPEVRVTARWGGAITSSSGLGLAPGTRCTIDATLVGQPSSLSVDTLEVRCGAQRIYGSQDELNGMSMTSSGAAERAVPGRDAKAYELVYQDTGDRTGARSQIQLRTDIQQARIWSEGLPSFEARLRVDRLSSDPAEPVTSGRSPRPR